jgi:hypothetical protein
VETVEPVTLAAEETVLHPFLMISSDVNFGDIRRV